MATWRQAVEHSGPHLLLLPPPPSRWRAPLWIVVVVVVVVILAAVAVKPNTSSPVRTRCPSPSSSAPPSLLGRPCPKTEERPSPKTEERPCPKTEGRTPRPHPPQQCGTKRNNSRSPFPRWDARQAGPSSTLPRGSLNAITAIQCLGRWCPFSLL